MKINNVTDNLAQSFLGTHSVSNNSKSSLDYEQKRTVTEPRAIIEGDYVRVGDEKTIEQAQELFSRAGLYEQYAKLDSRAAKGLETYQSLLTASERDSISELMGVDVYA